jgi:phenylalanyl-tRNA synthetase beta chain
MRLVLSWLREFVDVPESAEAVAQRLALCGFEVASVDELDGGDAVIDFEVTANRPDCLSVVGLAREVATAYDRPLRLPSAEAGANIALLPLERATGGTASDSGHDVSASGGDVRVSIEDPELCPRYAAAVAEVEIGPSASWMAERLLAAGLRPISTIVDITNYVSLEIGQPMHAFDLALLAGPEIRVRRARPGETITTLDGIERRLDVEMLVIADRDRAQAIAGIMGGAASEVSARTRRILFESACFHAVSVRRTSKRLNLKTEASTRFERGGDIGAQVTAIERAAALMQRLGTGTMVGGVIDCYPSPHRPRTLRLRRDRLRRLLGAAVPDEEVVRIASRLGLSISATADGWDLAIPTFRVDLLREADLIEEVGRHFGFDRLAPTFPPVLTAAPPPDPRTTRDSLVRRILTAAGLTEAVTFGFIEAKTAELFAIAGAAAVPIANPLSGKFDTLRASLLPGLVDAVAHNRRHGRRDVRLFEIGTRFAADGESRGVAVAWTGATGAEHWSGGIREVDFFDVKGLVERLCEVAGVPVRFEPSSHPALVPGHTARVMAIDGPERGAVLGIAGQLQPIVAEARGLPAKDRIVAAELDLDRLASARFVTGDRTRPLQRHPFVVRDLSIIVDSSLPAEIIRGTIQAASRDLAAPLAAISFFDRYQGKGIPDGTVSLSVRLTFQAGDRTLTDAEVQQSFDAIVAALVREHAAVQR